MADTFTAIIQQEDLLTGSTSISNPTIIETLAQVADVDLATLVDGSVLVYKTTTHKWTSTTTLNAQNMEGGEF